MDPTLLRVVGKRPNFQASNILRPMTLAVKDPAYKLFGLLQCTPIDAHDLTRRSIAHEVSKKPRWCNISSNWLICM